MTEQSSTHKQGSLAAQIAARRKEAKKDLSAELAVPTWEIGGEKSLLWSFRIVPKKILDDFADKKRSLEGDVTLLVEAHNGFYFLDQSRSIPGMRLEEDKDGRDRSMYVRCEDEDTGEVVGPDLSFATVIGFQPNPSSQASESTQLVLHLVQDNEAAIANMVGRLMAWQQNTDLDITKLMLGES